MPTEGPSHRSYLRDSGGPRAIDIGQSRTSTRRSTTDDRDSKRSKHSSTSKSASKPDSSHRRKPSIPQSSPKSSPRPSFELDLIGQPPKCINLGADIEASVLVSLRYPTSESRNPSSTPNIDTSRLFAVCTLLTESRTGERVAVEAGTLTGQKMCDSIHALPEQYAATLARNQPDRVSLGYCTFSGLLIRQSGAFRVRTTLIQATSAGASTLLTIDSDVIRVERPSRAVGRAHVC